MGNAAKMDNLDAIIQLDEWMFKNGLNEVQQNELELAVKYVAGQYVSAVSEAIEKAQAEAKAKMMHIVRKTGTMAMTHAVREWAAWRTSSFLTSILTSSYQRRTPRMSRSFASAWLRTVRSWLWQENNHEQDKGSVSRRDKRDASSPATSGEAAAATVEAYERG